ncbi:MAG: xylulokinase, partial [Vicinamibacterales bacterium]
LDMSLYLGLDSSTQSLSAIVLEVDGDRRRVAFESSIPFDETFPQYGTRHGVLPADDPATATSPPLLWVDALELMMRRLQQSDLDLRQLVAISGSAQQHGSVYLNDRATNALRSFDPGRPLAEQVKPILSREVAPIWMDSSTSTECAEIERAVGGDRALAERTGSRAFERFTAAQIRRLSKREPATYASTDRIHLVSSFLASLLIGRHAPLDPGDGSGMNLMDLASCQWWPPAVDSTAPGLGSKLPPIARASTVIGRVAPYWQARFGLPAAQVVTWSGDNPCSLVGVGLVREGRLGISLGTSDTVFGLMSAPRVDRTGTGHVFGAPTGDYMGLTCFKNGSLARERIRDKFHLSWSTFGEALHRTPPGNGGRIMLPWFEPEITPTVLTPGARRYGLDPGDADGNVRAVIEAQQMAMALHSRWMDVKVDSIHATGGAAANRDVLKVMADVFGAVVYQLQVGNSAALGAALQAFHGAAAAGGRQLSWEDIVQGFVEPLADSKLLPDPAHHAIYQDLIDVYAACEAHALGHGVDPSTRLAEFAAARE